MRLHDQGQNHAPEAVGGHTAERHNFERRNAINQDRAEKLADLRWEREERARRGRRAVNNRDHRGL